MREIQDMTLNLSRGLQGMEAKLRERSDRFAREFTRLETPEDAFGIRITGVPLSDDIRIESVFQGNDIINELPSRPSRSADKARMIWMRI